MYVKTYNTFNFSVQVQRAVTSKKIRSFQIIMMSSLWRNCFRIVFQRGNLCKGTS